MDWNRRVAGASGCFPVASRSLLSNMRTAKRQGGTAKGAWRSMRSSGDSIPMRRRSRLAPADAGRKGKVMLKLKELRQLVRKGDERALARMACASEHGVGINLSAREVKEIFASDDAL